MIKKQKEKKFVGTLLMAVIFTILFCSFVSAIGFSTIYSETNPLIMAPGEIKDIQVYTGSTPTEGDIKVRVTLVKGEEIATLIDEITTYDIKAGSLVPVNIRITIPANVAEGTEYTVGLVVRDITLGGGTVSTAGETGASFKVLVQKLPPPTPPTPTETPKEEGIGVGWWILGIIVVIAVIVIIYYIIKSRKK